MYKTLYVFMILYPWMIIPWGVNPYYTIPKSIYLIFFTILLWIMFLVKYLLKKIKIERIRVSDLFLLTFLAITILSTFFSVDIRLSLTGEWLRFEGLLAFVSYVSLFFFASRYIEEPDQIKVVKSTLYSSLLVAVYGILQHFYLDFLPRNELKVGWDRSYAFFDNPNFYGSYLELMIGLSVLVFFIGNGKKINSYFLFITSILFISLLYTYTRSAWLGVFILLASFTILILWKYRILWKKWLVLFIVLSSIFLIINDLEEGGILSRANTVVKDADSIIDGEGERAGSNRLYIWKKALPLTKDFFWLGSGPDTFAVVFPDNPDEKQKFFSNPNIKIDKAHNEFLQIGITLGIPALLTYLLFVSHILYKGIQLFMQKKCDKKEKLILPGLIFTIIGYLIQAFFNISVITVAPYYWIILGLVYRRIYSIDF